LALAEYKSFLKVHPASAYTAFVQHQITVLEKP
jgi:hypothetical protein